MYMSTLQICNIQADLSNSWNLEGGGFSFISSTSSNDVYINPIQDGLFWGCSRIGENIPPPSPSLKSITHILQ